MDKVGRQERQDQKFLSDDVAVIDFSAYLKYLVRELFVQFERRNITHSVESDETYLNVHTAVLCGLITNELVTNAIKHAFPDNREGSVHITFKQGYGHTAILTVRDTGIGFPPNFDITNRMTFGLKLINSYVKQLNGSITLVRNGGTTFTIQFPIDNHQ